MGKEGDYRRNAADTVDLAQRAETSRDKGRLLALAEKWLDLAERTHGVTSRVTGRPAQQHSLYSLDRRPISIHPVKTLWIVESRIVDAV